MSGKRYDIVVKHSIAFTEGNVTCLAARIVANNKDAHSEEPLNQEQIGYMRQQIKGYRESKTPPDGCDYRFLHTDNGDSFVLFTDTRGRSVNTDDKVLPDEDRQCHTPEIQHGVICLLASHFL